MTDTLPTIIKEAKAFFIETGADIEHARWSKWQEYFFSKCFIKTQSEVNGQDNRFVYFALPMEQFMRWQRQIATPYGQLSEEEKESDRREVRSYLPLLDHAITTAYNSRQSEIDAAREEGRREERNSVLSILGDINFLYGIEGSKNRELTIKNYRDFKKRLDTIPATKTPTHG